MQNILFMQNRVKDQYIYNVCSTFIYIVNLKNIYRNIITYLITMALQITPKK